jgi:hypothetical protein
MAAVALLLARDAVVDVTTAALTLGTGLVLIWRARRTDRGTAEP